MPSAALPVKIRCTGCNDSGDKECRQCGGAGVLEITECPLNIITMDVWETLELADLWEKGLPPVAGGALDQTANFIEAARFIFAEKSYWKKELGID